MFLSLPCSRFVHMKTARRHTHQKHTDLSITEAHKAIRKIDVKQESMGQLGEKMIQSEQNFLSAKYTCTDSTLIRLRICVITQLKYEKTQLITIW